MPFNHLIERVKTHPRQLFLVDGAGALLSAFMLGVVLVAFQSYVGIPVSTLYVLAAVPVAFAIFDLVSYFQGAHRSGLLLRTIAVLNLLYCCLSLGFAYHHSVTVTLLGWVYILGEVAIVAALAFFELTVAGRLGGK